MKIRLIAALALFFWATGISGAPGFVRDDIPTGVSQPVGEVATPASDDQPAAGQPLEAGAPSAPESVAGETKRVYNAAAVNPLMGAILPKEAEWRPLTGQERWRLYLNQTYANPGAYFRAFGSAAADHSRNEPAEWGQGFGPYMQRAGARFAIFTAQDSISAAGLAMLQWEPRYIRCKCEGAARRVGHALAWNFITYNREGKIRPNLPRIVGAYGAGALPALWRDDYKFTAQGVRAGNQQFFFGGFFNLIREFAPDIKRTFRK